MTTSIRVGPVTSLYRYPVKSLRGESPDVLEVEMRGVVGDRLYALRMPDSKLGSGKSSRRFRKIDGLLDLRSAYDGETPVITFPDGMSSSGEDPGIHEKLSAYAGQPVTLARESDIPHFDDSPLHVITTAGLRALGLSEADIARFRPNVVIDVPGFGFVEDAWIGRELQMGEVRLRITEGAERCVMIGMAQENLEDRPELLRQVGELHETCFGVYATVISPGEITVGMNAHLT